MNLIQLRRGEGAIRTVGEQYNKTSLKTVWRKTTDPDNIVIALVPEPDNRHDRFAVRMDVLMDGTSYKAGYMVSEEAREVHPRLMQLQSRGLVGFGYGKIRQGDSQFQVYARLSEDPSRLVPPHITDPIGTFVDGSYPLTVTGEENYQGVLEPYSRHPRDYVFAMHPTTVSKGKYAGEQTYSVYLDGNLVGELTRAMAQKHAARFDNIFTKGQRPYLLGHIEKDHRGLQVVLQQPNP